MAEIKLTKTELRVQQLKYDRLRKYLPTLQLKKALLQMEVELAQAEIHSLSLDFQTASSYVENYSPLFTERGISDLFTACEVSEVKTGYENIAGVDIPLFDRVIFSSFGYPFFTTPIWFDAAIDGIKKLLICKEKVKIAKEKKRLLEKELREVSIRVNLFEKILIPRSLEHIKKIKIFLGDQQLAAVCQAKVAKKKIQQRNEGKRS
ncbi:MAG: V-type ATP synthase subunit D [Chlamydiales bacterium]|nr:V-type ATP synthase subunit D [Chlamydiales bacterium]